MKNLLKTLVILLFLSNSALALDYVDVPFDYWAYVPIDKLTKEDVLIGYPNNEYLPDQYVTRAEYAVMIVKAIEQQNLQVNKIYSFEDVDYNHWAWDYITKCVELNILKPSEDNYFNPDDYVTRCEIITFLVNILKSEDIQKQDAILALNKAYKDFDDIPYWFRETAGKAEVLNLIPKEPGKSDILNYDGYLTRAQLAVFLANLRRELDAYKEAKIKEMTSPKMGDGIIAENFYLDDDVVTFPMQTVLPIMIIGQISSKNTQAGDMFQAKLADNIIDEEHHILLSKDIKFVGKVLDTTKAMGLIRNGEMIFELSAAKKDGNFTRILAVAEYEAIMVEANKVLKAAKVIFKGRNFIAKDGQILYIKLYRPIRANIVTGEILD